MGRAKTVTAEMISTAQAAERLGLTKRRVRQAADRLGGTRTETGRYVYSRQLVEEYRRRHDRRAEPQREQPDTQALLEQIIGELRAIRSLLERQEAKQAER